jgi:hypothetical protein
VWAIAALAEGLSIRAVARAFEVDPNTVLGWLVEASDHLQAFSHYFLHDLQVDQVQMDELFALLSAVKDGPPGASAGKFTVSGPTRQGRPHPSAPGSQEVVAMCVARWHPPRASAAVWRGLIGMQTYANPALSHGTSINDRALAIVRTPAVRHSPPQRASS